MSENKLPARYRIRPLNTGIRLAPFECPLIAPSEVTWKLRRGPKQKVRAIYGESSNGAVYFCSSKWSPEIRAILFSIRSHHSVFSQQNSRQKPIRSTTDSLFEGRNWVLTACGC